MFCGRDPSLGGNTLSAPAPIGNYSVDLTHVCVMKDSSGTGAGTCTGTVGSSSNAFSGATQLTVSQMLATSSSLSNAGGTAWYSNSATRGLAKNAFDAVKQSEGYGSLIARHDSRMKKEHRHIGAPLFMQTIEVAA
jgi:hypothetical protein